MGSPRRAPAPLPSRWRSLSGPPLTAASKTAGFGDGGRAAAKRRPEAAHYTLWPERSGRGFTALPGPRPAAQPGAPPPPGRDRGVGDRQRAGEALHAADVGPGPRPSERLTGRLTAASSKVLRRPQVARRRAQDAERSVSDNPRRSTSMPAIAADAKSNLAHRGGSSSVKGGRDPTRGHA